MLVLSRHRDEDIVITVPPSVQPQEIVITTVDIRGDKARLGVTADRSVTVHRREVHDAIQREGARQTIQLRPTGTCP